MLIEVAREGNLVADLVLLAVHPGIGGIWQYLALEVCLDVIVQGDVLGVAQRAIRLGVSLPVGDLVAILVQQRSLDSDGGVAEVVVLEYLRQLRIGIFEGFVKRDDLLDLLVGELLALAAEALSHFRIYRWR